MWRTDQNTSSSRPGLSTTFRASFERGVYVHNLFKGASAFVLFFEMPRFSLPARRGREEEEEEEASDVSSNSDGTSASKRRRLNGQSSIVSF